jgi:hypothetical protein
MCIRLRTLFTFVKFTFFFMFYVLSHSFLIVNYHMSLQVMLKRENKLAPITLMFFFLRLLIYLLIILLYSILFFNVILNFSINHRKHFFLLFKFLFKLQCLSTSISKYLHCRWSSKHLLKKIRFRLLQ